MATNHPEGAAFNKVVDGGYDPEIKTWAARTVPILVHHLELAENANSVVNGVKGK